MEIHFTRKTLINSIRVFVILVLAGFLLVFYLTGTGETLTALKDFKLYFILLVWLMVAADILLGSFRVYIFIRKLSNLPAARAFRASIKADLSNTFMGAATPFQTGGGIAQIYILRKEGLSVPDATGIGIINFMTIMSIMMVAGPLVLRRLATDFSGLKLALILNLSTGLFYLVTIFFFIFLIKPLIIGKMISRILRWLESVFTKKQKTIQKFAEIVKKFVQDYDKTIRHLWHNEKSTLIFSLLLTFILFFNKCAIAYVILKGMGLDPNFWHAVSLQFTLIFLIYFYPTPGASFLAEASTAALMTLIIPRHLVSVYTVLWRFFATYFGVILGGIILMRAVGNKKTAHGLNGL